MKLPKDAEYRKKYRHINKANEDLRKLKEKYSNESINANGAISYIFKLGYAHGYTAHASEIAAMEFDEDLCLKSLRPSVEELSKDGDGIYWNDIMILSAKWMLEQIKNRCKE